MSDKMVRALLEAGASNDVNAAFGTREESALHVSAARGAEKASKALMAAGADPNIYIWVTSRIAVRSSTSLPKQGTTEL
ncbi:unnamed protein product [Ectocarpus fasciculatus]